MDNDKNKPDIRNLLVAKLLFSTFKVMDVNRDFNMVSDWEKKNNVLFSKLPCGDLAAAVKL